MAEEDLIFGKNRHMFGGIEPSNMLKFTLARVNNKIQITAQLPNDTIIDNQLLCTVGGAIIRRKATDYPVDEFDGDFVANIKESGSIIDSEADINSVYYYSAFPYSTQDVYNRGYKNRAKYSYPSATYYFGFDLDTKDPNPNTRVTYPDDVMNTNYTAAGMNYTTGVFNYGGWPSTPGDKFMPIPCSLFTDTSTKTTQIEFDLDPNDYTKKADGTIHDRTREYNNVNFMMRWPKIYTYREVINGIYKFRCSDVKLGEDWDCICNYDIHGDEIDNFFTAIYSYAPGRFSVPSSTDANVSEVFQKPKNNLGMGWNVEALSDRLLIQDLLIMMAKSTDFRLAYGDGQYSGSTVSNGLLDSKGLFYGKHDTSSPVKVFGMENYWGNYYRLLGGFLIVGGTIKIKLTGDYNTTGQGYLIAADLADYMTTIGSYGGYISDMLTNSYGRIPIVQNGSVSTYETDRFSYFRSSSDSSIMYARTGGIASNGGGSNNIGLFYITATESVSSSSSTPAAIYLSYKAKLN